MKVGGDGVAAYAGAQAGVQPGTRLAVLYREAVAHLARHGWLGHRGGAGVHHRVRVIVGSTAATAVGELGPANIGF